MGLVAIAGGGAAGVFAAIACAERAPSLQVVVFEKSREVLAKVRISGGGRCNVTHAEYDPRRLSEYYPRGGKALIGALHRFQPRDMEEWLSKRGVALKREPDGRMFPVTDSSATIVECLVRAARDAGVSLRTGASVEQASRCATGGFNLRLSNGEQLHCDKLMLGTGGCRGAGAGQLAISLGHSLVPPVPSLFAFQLDEPWLAALAGVSVQRAEVSVPATRLRERGALLITHNGISGPAVLRVSAWGARELHAKGYRFTARIDWLPDQTPDQVLRSLQALKARNPAKQVSNVSLPQLPLRLWEAFLARAAIPKELRWAEASNAVLADLVAIVTSLPVQVVGKSLNKDEFVTCGGVPLKEVDFKTMESKVCPRLFLAGELLDIDGVTGGFNFQAAWTTGWIAGNSMATY